jgi:hypothetical protein
VWIFMQDTFVTISQDANQRDRFMIRARVAGDIEKLFPKAQVIRLDDADFRFRAFVPKARVVEVLGRAIGSVDYTSFKSGVKDKCRAWFYTRVWSITADMQDACEELRETGSPVV